MRFYHSFMINRPCLSEVNPFNRYKWPNQWNNIAMQQKNLFNQNKVRLQNTQTRKFSAKKEKYENVIIFFDSMKIIIGIFFAQHFEQQATSMNIFPEKSIIKMLSIKMMHMKCDCLKARAHHLNNREIVILQRSHQQLMFLPEPNFHTESLVLNYCILCGKLPNCSVFAMLLCEKGELNCNWNWPSNMKI